VRPSAQPTATMPNTGTMMSRIAVTLRDAALRAAPQGEVFPNASC
jgi:hypothetical protein